MSAVSRNRAPHAGAIEYTDLRKGLRYRDVECLCREALFLGLGAVVVPTMLVSTAAEALAGSGVGVGCVVSYPFGTQPVAGKQAEIEAAVRDGATEIDVVPHLGTVRAERWADVEAELVGLRRASAEVPLKLVIEMSLLDHGVVRSVADLASDLGYDYLVSSAGFRVVSTRPESAGAATTAIVERMVEAARGRLRVKAAGGVTSAAQIAALVSAGAERVAVDAASATTLWEGA